MSPSRPQQLAGRAVPPERVTVAQDGYVRCYESNGSGLVEWATIRGDLKPEDAALLTYNLAAFLEATDRARGPLGSPQPIPAAARLSGPPRGASQAPRAGPTTQNRVVEWIATHPGVTRAQLRQSLNLSLKQAANALDRTRRMGLVRPEGGGWYATDQIEAPLTVRPRQRAARPTAYVKRPPDEIAEVDATILAHVNAHPGTARVVVGNALGIERVLFGNRVRRLETLGLLKQRPLDDHDPRDRRRALWPGEVTSDHE